MERDELKCAIQLIIDDLDVSMEATSDEILEKVLSARNHLKFVNEKLIDRCIEAEKKRMLN